MITVFLLAGLLVGTTTINQGDFYTKNNVRYYYPDKQIYVYKTDGSKQFDDNIHNFYNRHYDDKYERKYQPVDNIDGDYVKSFDILESKNKRVYVFYFDFAKADLTKEHIVALNQLASSYEPSKVKVFVSGYTDDVGSQEINDKLSRERAENVANFLKNKGFKVVYEGEGKCCYASDKRWRNRRVEVEFEEVSYEK